MQSSHTRITGSLSTVRNTGTRAVRNPISTCGKAREVNILFGCKTSQTASSIDHGLGYRDVYVVYSQPHRVSG